MVHLTTSSDAGQRPRHALITGGAGFIGSHLADRLLADGCRVRALDCLCEQVHGRGEGRPEYLDERVDLRVGDVRDPRAMDEALEGVDTVFHLAAAVGVGQSMVEIERYTSVNAGGTAVLLEALRRRREPIRRLVVASSMSVYGEGRYLDADGAIVDDAQREEHATRAGDWACRRGGRALTPVATPEDKRPALASVYALSKYEQECKCLIFGRAFDVPTVGLRFFNAYGPRQALSNPYTGVIAIFASRLLNGRAPVVFEDGRQRRDFVSVHDVAEACRLAATAAGVDGKVVNIGSGRGVTIREIAELVADALGCSHIEPEISGEYRAGDIRHCFADITRAARVLGYRPEWTLERGIRELAEWLRDRSSPDRVDSMRHEMRRAGVTRATDGGRSRGSPARTNGAPARTRPAPALLVTGGCGFVGTHMVLREAGRGRAVRVLDNFSREGARANARMLRERFGDRVEIIAGDVTDGRVVAAAVRGVGRVLHLAAQVAVTTSLDAPMADFETNARGTLNVLEAVRTHRPQAHLIFASTNKVYGDQRGLALRRAGVRYEPVDAAAAAQGLDEGPLSFHSPYGCSKGAADQYVLDYARSFGLLASVARMSCIYGSLQRGTEDQGWVAHFLRRALRDETITIFGDGRQVRDLLYATDLIDAYDAIWSQPEATAGEAYNIGGGPDRAMSLLELLDALQNLLDRPIHTRFEPWRTGDQRYFVSDTRALRAATGWGPRVDIPEGLERLRSWLEWLEGGDTAPAPDHAIGVEVHG